MFTRNKAVTLLLFALAVALLLAAPASHAQAPSSEGIAVLVNDEPISNYDVQQRLRLLQLSTRQAPNERMRRQVIDELINERLMMQEAKRLNISVSNDEVNQALGTIAGRTNMQLQQFAQALGQSGVNIKTLANRIRSELAWREVIQARFRRTVQVREEDVDTALQTKEGPKTSVRYEYKLQNILLVVTPGSSQDAVRGRIREADTIRRGFRSCDTARSQVAGIRDVVISDMGTRTSESMPGGAAKLLENVDVNQTTEPRAVERGIELVAVCAKKELTDDKAVRRQIEGQLINQEFTLLAKRHLRDLRQDAVIDIR